MAFFTSLLISLAISVIGELLRPKQKFDKPKPSGLGDFNFPTADATRVIPVFVGRVKMQGPNVVWFGDLRSAAVTKKVKTGWFSSDRVTLGFNYFLGVQFVFGWGGPEVKLIDFLFDDKSVLNNLPTKGLVETADDYSFVMNKPTLLGNDEPSNGVAGPVKLYKGTATQQPNGYLANKLTGGKESGFRRLCYGVLEHCYLGNSDTPPPMAAILERCPNQLGLQGGQHTINGDANPACWCYEIMTDDIWGLNIDPALIDIETFRACGTKLFNESFGVSMIVDNALQGRELLAEVLRHVDGVIFADPRTGLYVMRLARDDYNVNTLELFDNSNIAPGSFEFSRISWEDTKNTTTVNYLDRDQNYTTQPVQYQDLANVFVRKGQITSESIDFLAITNKALALKVAARANKLRSSPLARCGFTTDRSAYSVLPGDVIRVHKPDYGIIAPLIMRVVDVGYGTLDDPSVKITCTEDIFAINAYAYGAPQDTGWAPVYQPASPLRMHRVIEAPYEMNGSESRRLMVLGVRNDFVTTGFEIWLDETNTGTQYKLTNMAYGTLAGGVLRSTAGSSHNASTTLIVEGVMDPQMLRSVTPEERDRGGALLIVNNEIMGYSGISVAQEDGAVTVTGLIRGLFDTEQSAHPAGSPAIFFNESIPLVDTLPLAKDGPVKVKLVPFNGKDSLTLADVPEITVTADGRAFRPNPTGPIYLNSIDYRVTSTDGSYMLGPSGDVEITWEWRNKAHRGALVHELSTGIEPEPGSGVRVTVQQGARTLQIPYTDYQPVMFRFAQDGNIVVTIETIDFDGQVAGLPRVLYIDYYAGAAATDEIWQPPPPVDTTPAIEIAPYEGVLYLDCNYDHFIVNLTSDAVVVFQNVEETEVLLLEVRQQGDFNLSWPANVRFLAGTPYVVTPVPGAVNMVGVITLDTGANWNLKASQPGAPDGQVPMVLTLNTNAISASASGMSGQNVTATTAPVIGEAANATEPVAFEWTRTDTNGGADFELSNLEGASTTFSHTSQTSSTVVQNWTLTAVDADGSTAAATVQVTLATENAVAGLSASISPSPAYSIAAYPNDVAVTVQVTATGGSGDFSYSWYKISGAAGIGIVGSTTSRWATFSRSTTNTNVVREAVFGVTITDNATQQSIQRTVDVSLESERGGGGGTQPL